MKSVRILMVVIFSPLLILIYLGAVLLNLLYGVLTFQVQMTVYFLRSFTWFILLSIEAFIKRGRRF